MLPYLGLVAVIIAWASGYVAGAAALQGGGFGPLWMTALRLGFAALVVGVLALSRGERFTLPGRADLVRGGLTWVSGTGFIAVGQQTVGAGTTAFVFAAAPLMALVLQGILFRVWPGMVAWAGVITGALGVAMLIGEQPEVGTGLMWILAACFSWCLAQVYEARSTCGRGALAIGATHMAVGAVGTAALALATAEPLPTPSWTGLSAFLWLAGPTSAFAYPAWLWVLKRLPLHIAMLQGSITPLVATGLGVALLDEHVGVATVVGGVLILGAAQVVSRTRMPAPVAEPQRVS